MLNAAKEYMHRSRREGIQCCFNFAGWNAGTLQVSRWSSGFEVWHRRIQKAWLVGVQLAILQPGELQTVGSLCHIPPLSPRLVLVSPWVSVQLCVGLAQMGEASTSKKEAPNWEELGELGWGAIIEEIPEEEIPEELRYRGPV